VSGAVSARTIGLSLCGENPVSAAPMRTAATAKRSRSRPVVQSRTGGVGEQGCDSGDMSARNRSWIVPAVSFVDLADTFHRANARVMQARAAAARRDVAYAATPDGLAEAQRCLDLSAAGDDRDPLQTLVTAGVRAAAAEFRQRCVKGEPEPGDGYLFPLPLNEHTPLASLLVQLNVLGTWRIKSTGDATVQLLRIDVATGDRHRCTITLPRPPAEGLTLPGVVRTAFTDPRSAGKVKRLLGEMSREVVATVMEECSV
jgi:hypothetical protein